MLERHIRERLLDRLGLPPAGRRLVLDAAKFAPVRQPQSKGGGNVLTPFDSLKMACTVPTESKDLEFPAVVGYEHDPAVLEYYAQPMKLKFEWIDDSGEIHVIEHTPDFLVITEQGVWVDEWKHWTKLEGLARRKPWRYQLSPDDCWRSIPVEQWLGERGIHYRIRTDREIPRRRVENILMLEDYFHPSAPPCPIDIASRIKDELADEPTLFLTELYEKAECRADDVFKMIADGHVIADLDHAALEEPNCCRVFRDRAVRDFEHARKHPEIFQAPGVVEIRPGARLMYNHERYTVGVVGAGNAVLVAEDGGSAEVPIAVLEQLASGENLVAEAGAPTKDDLPHLSDFSESELREALNRLEELRNIAKPTRNQRRLLNAVAIAKMNGTDEVVALVPRTRDRGNRNPRLEAAQEAAMEEIIRTVWLTNRAAGMKHCHRKLKVLCAERGITAPAYPTLIERIKAIPQMKADRARHGKRVAYQNADFVTVLREDTPVHGSRAFQYVHVDHTELDVELVSLKTGKSLGRPWLSLAIDAFTRRIVGIYLTYAPPSYESVLMVLRDIVRRYRRLPQFIVLDNGKEFHSENFKQFCRLMRIHRRYRPAGQPRFGAVMERIFGRLHTEYIHNLAGNTKATKKVRTTTGKFLPSRLAEWSLEQMYYGLEYWAFEYYDQCQHVALGVSPRVAFEQSLIKSGERQHRIVTLTKDFLIQTCPSVTRRGSRKVDRQRGIKVHANYYYWCPEFRDPKVVGKAVPARYDPWDWATVYVQVGKRWVPAQCRALASLGRMTTQERELLSAEYAKRYPSAANEEPTPQRLSEFMRVFEPEGATQLAVDRLQESRLLYENLGLGPVDRLAVPPPSGFLPPPDAPPVDRASPSPSATSKPAPEVSKTSEVVIADLPRFELF